MCMWVFYLVCLSNKFFFHSAELMLVGFSGHLLISVFFFLLLIFLLSEHVHFLCVFHVFLVGGGIWSICCLFSFLFGLLCCMDVHSWALINLLSLFLPGFCHCVAAVILHFCACEFFIPPWDESMSTAPVVNILCGIT